MNLRRVVITFALPALGLFGPYPGIKGQTVEGQKAVVIHAGQLFDGKSDRLLSNQAIVIQGERITDVGPAGSIKVPVGAQEIDLGKATVLPGLIDGHGHLFKWGATAFNMQTLLRDSWQYRTILAVVNAKKDLEAGFTTVRDPASVGAMYSDTDVRRAINEGVVPGPRLYVATMPLIGTTWWPIEPAFSPEATLPEAGRVVDSPWEGRKAVRENIKYGADFIKLFPGNYTSHGRFGPDGRLLIQATMTLEEDKAIVDEAHRQGVKTACHTEAGISLRESVEAGCDTIELGVDVDPESITRMAEKGIFLTMELTLGKFSEPSDLKATQGKYSRAAMEKATLERALKAGVKIGFAPNTGSDTRLDHGGQAKEFESMVNYGMTPAQALHAATTVNAEMMGWQDRVGTIEKGKYADVIAVSGNPLDDITELERVKFVMKGGEIVRNDLK